MPAYAALTRRHGARTADDSEVHVARHYRYYRPFGLFTLLYLLVGVFVAFDRNYITASLLKQVFSALLAILLWFLVLLGVDLHIR